MTGLWIIHGDATGPDGRGHVYCGVTVAASTLEEAAARAAAEFGQAPRGVRPTNRATVRDAFESAPWFRAACDRLRVTA